MGYLFFALSVCFGTTKGYCGKKLGDYTNGVQDSVHLNLLRMILCVVFGLIFLLLFGDVNTLSPSRPSF